MTKTLRTYWITWGVLLVFTVLMLSADGAASAIPRAAFIGFMLTAMLLKAGLIGGNFMHLRSERAGLVLTVIVGLFVTGTILYVLIVPDALRIHQMVNAQ
jgi:cytochrome c oxidase subunit IV